MKTAATRPSFVLIFHVKDGYKQKVGPCWSVESELKFKSLQGTGYASFDCDPRTNITPWVGSSHLKPWQCPIFLTPSFDAIFPELVAGNILKGFIPLCLGGTTIPVGFQVNSWKFHSHLHVSSKKVSEMWSCRLDKRTGAWVWFGRKGKMITWGDGILYILKLININ